MTSFLDAARHPEFWRYFALLLVGSVVVLGPAIYLAVVFERARRREAALDRIAAETRGQFRRVK
jgi:hypothetical protein